ncbi:MAG: response regulator transcription factor [Clostridiaceae bacterium]|nr:response regulator transcription factor [Clostridiaceae bacterium]
MNTQKTILVIEDEQHIAHVLETLLSDEGYQVVSASAGAEALDKADVCLPDVFLLDLGLPDMDGMTILKKLRQRTTRPVIVVSARTREQEKVMALDLGADDYVTKPFGAKELKARIRSAIRHASINRMGDTLGKQEYICGALMVDFTNRRVLKNHVDVRLTNVEYQIVSLISRACGKVLTYDQIISSVWGPYADADNNRILRVNMANIRRKIEENPAVPQYIFTEVGVGYRMADEKNSLASEK